jgi:ABC-type amino acid transport system permease subunit
MSMLTIKISQTMFFALVSIVRNVPLVAVSFLIFLAVCTNVVDPKIFVMDPDSTFQRVRDPDPTSKKLLTDPVSDLALIIYSSSRTMIFKAF